MSHFRLSKLTLLLVAAAVLACGEAGVDGDAGPERAAEPLTGRTRVPAGRGPVSLAADPAADAALQSPATFHGRAGDPSDLTRQPLEPARGDFRRIDIVPGSPMFTRHLAGGWSVAEHNETDDWAWSVAESSAIWFELDSIRPVRLELRATPFRAPPTPRPQSITVWLNREPVKTIALKGERSDYAIELPPAALQIGRNDVDLHYEWIDSPRNLIPGNPDPRELAVRFDFLRLVSEQGSGPIRPQRVAVTLPDAERPLPGLGQGSDGQFSFLLWPPAGSELSLGIAGLTEAAGSAAEARYRVTLEWDGGGRRLFEGALPLDAQMRDLRAPLDHPGGGAVRLVFEVEGLPADARWTWVEPRIEAPDSATAAASPGKRVPAGTNVVVVVIDAAARGHFGLYGYPGGTTPFIDSLAPESLVFDAAFAQASYTLPSTCSLLTSLLPADHGVLETRDRLSSEAVTLAEVLGEAGYATGAFSGNPYVSKHYNTVQGFGDVEELFRGRATGDVARVSDIYDPVEAWIEEHREQPFFLYVHFVQPHEPYDAAPDPYYRGLDSDYDGRVTGEQDRMLQVFRGEVKIDGADVEHLRKLYDGNLRFADEGVARVVGRLRDLGLLESSILLVTSDHGESLGERGTFGHGQTVDAELISLPMLLRLPAEMGARGRVAHRVGSIDFMPTTLELLGMQGPPSMRGRNLLDARGDRRDSWQRLLVTVASGRSGTASVVAPGFKYSYDKKTGGERLLPLPLQEDAENLRWEHPVTFDYLALAKLHLTAPSHVLEREARGELPAETREALEALGYVVE